MINRFNAKTLLLGNMKVNKRNFCTKKDIDSEGIQASDEKLAKMLINRYFWKDLWFEDQDIRLHVKVFKW